MKTNLLLTLCALFAASSLFAQDAAKSVKPLLAPPKSSIPNPPSTRAVVVGISDYQSKDIPDLRFADADALAFAEWLKSTAGGSVPADNILLLKNAEATYAAFAAALDWLVEVSQEGDKALIYFSGHGDVETKTASQLGFLLLHDSPARCYKAGAYPLYYLQDVISTLSTQNKARVTVVTDACHAGKLAGTGVNGTQATALNLAKQFANETKILSCQPNEYSLEGEQWGGGRGVFSWHLMDGLTGLADKDTNGTVSLFELGRYLEDMVPAETAPISQMPMTVGDRQTALARVDAPTLAMLRTAKEGQKTALAATAPRGFEEVCLANADSLTQRLYADFKIALQQRELLEAGTGHRSADDLFRELSAAPQFAPMHALLRRNFAVALQDEVQQALNALLDNDPYEANNWQYNPQKYTLYPAYLARTIELLGEKHYMATALRAKQLFFEGYNFSRQVAEHENEPLRRDSLKSEAKKLLIQSFALDGEAAYVPYTIGMLYQFNTPPQTDSVVLWCGRAVWFSPTWLSPYLDIAHEYSSVQSDAIKAEGWILRAQAQDSTAYVTLERLSWLRLWQFLPAESLAISEKMIALKPDLFNAYSTAAVNYFAAFGDYEQSEKYCLRSLELNPNQLWWAYQLLGLNYIHTSKCKQAIEHFNKGIPKANAYEKGFLYAGLVQALVQTGQYVQAEKTIAAFETGHFGTPNHQTWVAAEAGRMWLQRGELEKAEAVLLHALTIDPTPDPVWIQINAHLGMVKNRQGKPSESEGFFQKAVQQEKLWESFHYLEEAHILYGQFLLSQHREAEARAQFDKCREYRPKGWRQAYGLALLAAKHHKKTKALDCLEQSLNRYLPRKELLLEEPLFAKIRKTKRFKALMLKHFPEE